MTLQPWPHIGDEALASYKVFDVRRATRRSPRTGAERGFFLLDTPDWVNIVALTERDELIMVRQYRHGTREFSLEIPGGLIDAGECHPEQAAARMRELCSPIPPVKTSASQRPSAATYAPTYFLTR